MGWSSALQTTPGGNSATVVLNNTSASAGAFGSAVTLNNFVVCWVAGDNSSTTVAGNITASDNGSTPNTYTQLQFKTASFTSSKIWVAIFVAQIMHNPSSGNLNPKVQSSQSGSNLEICAAEFSGGTTTTDGTSNNTGNFTGTSPTCGNITTTVANDLLLAAFAAAQASGTDSWTNPSGYTSVGQLTNAATSDVMQGLYKIASGTVTNNNPSWTSFTGPDQSSSHDGWVAVQAALEPASATFQGDETEDGVQYYPTTTWQQDVRRKVRSIFLPEPVWSVKMAEEQRRRGVA